MKKLSIRLTICLLQSCGSEVSKEYRQLVNAVDHKVKNIDHNHRIQIIEDDFVRADSLYKVRGYFSEGRLLKLVGIIKPLILSGTITSTTKTINPSFQGT